MKTLGLIIIAILLVGINGLSAQTKWETKAEVYNGNEYLIRYTPRTYSIKNKKYDFSDSFRDTAFDGESSLDMDKRRQVLIEKMYEVANSVFEFNKIVISGRFEVIMECLFDINTKKYAGVRFIFDAEIKDYITVPKINLVETKLLQAGLNAGSTNIIEQGVEYVVIGASISVGKE